MWPMRIPIVFQKPLTVPCTAPTAGKLPAVRAVQGDCERVYRTLTGECEHCVQISHAIYSVHRIPPAQCNSSYFVRGHQPSSFLFLWIVNHDLIINIEHVEPVRVFLLYVWNSHWLVYLVQLSINPLRTDNAYILLFQLMAWCRVDNKPLPEPVLTYCRLDPTGAHRWNLT